MGSCGSLKSLLGVLGEQRKVQTRFKTNKFSWMVLML